MSLVWGVGEWFIAIGILVIGYAYAGYPVLLWLIGKLKSTPIQAAEPREWPLITIVLAAYNEERVIEGTIESLLALDYPADRRHVLVISDASTDGTDAIVRRFAARGVELLRLAQRGGKTAAENAARTHLRGTIIVNTDASVRIGRDALKALIGRFSDPTIGVASGRDVSLAQLEGGGRANQAEAGYVGYEMWVRDLETRVGSIVGASGCFYAIRVHLHMNLIPEALSRDFAAALVAREQGMRAVSVREAVCYVPRTASLRAEYRRKVRTITRGLDTLYYKRALLNPLRYGAFSWMLASHKLCRWLVPWSGVAILLGFLLLAPEATWPRWPLALLLLGVLGGIIAWYWPESPRRKLPLPLAWCGYLVSSNLAVIQAWIGALRGDLTPTWEPTRRPAPPPAA